MSDSEPENYAAVHDDYSLTPVQDFVRRGLIAWAAAIAASTISPTDGPRSIAPLNAIIVYFVA